MEIVIIDSRGRGLPLSTHDLSLESARKWAQPGRAHTRFARQIARTGLCPPPRCIYATFDRFECGRIFVSATFPGMSTLAGKHIVLGLSGGIAAFKSAELCRALVKAGVTVQVENLATGFKRALAPDAQGRYQITGLPTGNYRVSLIKDGKAVETTNDVQVLIGQGSEVSFGTTQVVEVLGRKQRLDMSSANNGVTFTQKDLDALPISRNVEAIIQLAPNTTRADPRYSGGASMGGGAPSENSYYINGFPVTNPLNQLGFSQLPFGAISQAQVLTGGFGAEFGRSVGGVVNITTRRPSFTPSAEWALTFGQQDTVIGTVAGVTTLAAGAAGLGASLRAASSAAKASSREEVRAARTRSIAR